MTLCGCFAEKKTAPKTNKCSISPIYHYRISVSMGNEGGERNVGFKKEVAGP